MPYRTIPFANGEIYHIFNRGLSKQNIFVQTRDYSVFLESLFYYQIQSPKPKFSLYRQTKTFPVDKSKRIVDIICYCLMPNHFHILLKQVKDNGISEFMRKFGNSFTKYINTKYQRQGPLFQGMFKAVHIESDEQLVHVSRYIHLNPYVSGIVRNLKLYRWSSYSSFIGLEQNQNVLAQAEVLNHFKAPEDYERFVMDQADYGAQLERIKHQIIDADF